MPCGCYTKRVSPFRLMLGDFRTVNRQSCTQECTYRGGKTCVTALHTWHQTVPPDLSNTTRTCSVASALVTASGSTHTFARRSSTNELVIQSGASFESATGSTVPVSNSESNAVGQTSCVGRRFARICRRQAALEVLTIGKDVAAVTTRTPLRLQGLQTACLLMAKWTRSPPAPRGFSNTER